MESVRFRLFTKRRKAPKSWHYLKHPAICCSIFCELIYGTPIPVICRGDLTPPELIDVIQCHCKSHGKRSRTDACGCHKQHLSCTSFCNCSGEGSCSNPFAKLQKDVEEHEEEDEADPEAVERRIFEEDNYEAVDKEEKE